MGFRIEEFTRLLLMNTSSLSKLAFSSSAFQVDFFDVFFCFLWLSWASLSSSLRIAVSALGSKSLSSLSPSSECGIEGGEDAGLDFGGESSS